jgi:hypothetical protein
MGEHKVSEKPEWSCGGYVYEDAIGPRFSAVKRDGVLYPVMDDPGPAQPITGATVIATIRWLRPEECPEHGPQSP